MSLTVTQRPYQTINAERSDWNAVANPVLYKMQRKDFTFSSITNSAGFARLVLDSSFGDLTASILVDDSIYLKSDDDVYDEEATVELVTYSAPNTLVTLSTAYVSTAIGFINNFTLRPSYRVEVEVYDNETDTILSDTSFFCSPTATGALSMDVSKIIQSTLEPDNEAAIDTSAESFEDTTFVAFYIKYREVWRSSAESQTSDSDHVFHCLLGAMQIPSLYGGNLYEYLILSDMKITRTNITSAQILTGNATPVNVTETPNASSVIVPIMFLIYLDYNSAAYATNTDFRFEINGVAVTASNTTILLGTADRYTVMVPIGYDTTTSMLGQPIKFEVQTGNPTAGNSPLRIDAIYTIREII